MGGCASTSNTSACSANSNEEPKGDCFRFGKKKTRRQGNVGALHHAPSLPSNVCTNGRSRSSCVYTQQGRKGVNQDAMVVWEDFASEDVTFCGVFDGHGPHGHLVARRVRDNLPVKLLSSLSRRSNNNEEDDSSAEDNVISFWREGFMKSYKAMDKELKSHPNVDCFCSGSTAVTIVKQELDLFISYIGDSRAVMGSREGDGSMVSTQLTIDLKPDLPREAERIKRCKGRVFALQDEPEVPRVWLPFDDAPGLAMARAFGDFCLKEYGVISVPEFCHRKLTEKDEFVVLASDGVWDVLSNDEVVEIVASAPVRSSAARILVNSAAREWMMKYPTSKMDDCAVVCLFLDGKMEAESEDEDHAIYSNKSSSVVDADRLEPSLQRNVTVRSADEEAYARLAAAAEERPPPEDQPWSGLEGVTRVNSLVHLPRFSAPPSS